MLERSRGVVLERSRAVEPGTEGGGAGRGRLEARRAAIAGVRLCKNLQKSQISESWIEPLISRMGQNWETSEQTKRFSEISNEMGGRSRVVFNSFSEICNKSGRSRDIGPAKAFIFLGITHIGAGENTSN